MRDFNYEMIYNAFIDICTYFYANFWEWIFYVIGYLFVVFFCSKILENIATKVEESKNSRAKYRHIYPSIKKSLVKLKNSETKVFFTFVAAMVILFLYNDLFQPLSNNPNIPTQQAELIELINWLSVYTYYILIYVFPNYSRYKTYYELSKILK